MVHPTVIGRGWALLTLLAYPVVLGLLRRHGRLNPWRALLAVLALLYAAAVAAATIFPIDVFPAAVRARDHWWAALRLIPFVVPPSDFLLNVVMFLPFGFLLPQLWPAVGTRKRIAVCGLAASATIEFSQLAMWIGLGNARSFDVNDLMSNTTGAVLGLMLLRALTSRSAGEPHGVGAGSR